MRTYLIYEVIHGPEGYVESNSLYATGLISPNYPVPALYDTYPDQEYLVMLYEQAMLTQELRDLRNETQQ